MNESLIKEIHNSGLKKKYIAKQLSIHPTMLSLCIRGDRFLNPDKEKQLKELLEKAS
jgi:hypothetical protein